MIDWSSIKYFTPPEFGNEEAQKNVNSTLVWLIDDFRKAIMKPIKIHEAWALTGHLPTGYHPKGEAVDCHIEGLSIWEQFFLALRFGAFKGIGIYPYWNNQGLHLDIRKENLITLWWCDRNKKYQPVTKEFIGKITLI